MVNNAISLDPDHAPHNMELTRDPKSSKIRFFLDNRKYFFESAADDTSLACRDSRIEIFMKLYNNYIYVIKLYKNIKRK